MVFSSLTFLFYFLPIALLVYYITPKRGRNLILFLTGLVFYAWGEPVYVVIMVLSTLIDYIAGRMMDLFKTRNAKTACLVVSVAMNLSLLGIFKYGSFLIQNINALLGVQIPDPGFALPIGISFYTFQSMSYTIDLYMGNIKVQRSFIRFGAYVTMFPQLVAGPIVRYEEVERELSERTVSIDRIGEGVGTFVSGLAKKVLLANNIGALWVAVKAMPTQELTALTAWLGILAFTFQIYFDFSGYSDMAIGMGKMLGFTFPQNFNYPYISRSISEFWRRWHMTLSGWFRSYVYIPLGGNRHGQLKTVRNLLIVWALTGLWHGASWNFILWGLYFGVIIMLERLFLGRLLARLPAALSWAYSFLLVVFGWVLFEAESLTWARGFFGAMFGANRAGLLDGHTLYLLASYGMAFALCIIAASNLPKRLYTRLGERFSITLPYSMPVVQLVVLLLCVAYLVDATYNPFLYFRF